MSDDVIALDPDRMAVLGAYLQGLGDDSRRRSARIGAEVAWAGSTVPVASEVTALDDLALRCQRLRDEVEWRRALLADADEPLPRTSWVAFDHASALAAVDVLALRLGMLVDSGPAARPVLVHALEDLARLGGSEELSARLLARLGAGRARELQARFPDVATDPRGRQLVETVRLGTAHDGHGALDERWFGTYLELPADVADLDAGSPRVSEAVEEGLRAAGYGARFVGWAAKAISWMASGPTAEAAGRVSGAASALGGAVSIARAPFALTDGDGAEFDVPEAGLLVASGTLTIAGAATMNIPLAIAGAAVGLLATLFGAGEHQEGSAAQRTYNEGTGSSTYAGGGDATQWQDGAGGAIDSHTVVGG